MGCKSSKQLAFEAKLRIERRWERSNPAANPLGEESDDVDKLAKCMSASRMLQDLSLGHLKTLAASTMQREYFDMEPVYLEADDSDGIFYVKTGQVELTSLQQGILATISRGQIFGEKDLVNRVKRTQNAFARGPSTILWRISRSDYYQVMVNRNAVTELPTYLSLSDSVILFGLDEPQLISLHSHAELETFAPNECIFRRGAECSDKLYIVHTGSVTITDIASDYSLDAMWKLEWIGLNTFVVLGPAGYFGDSNSDPSGLEANAIDMDGNVVVHGHTVTAHAGPKGCALLTVSKFALSNKPELRVVQERVIMNIQGRDTENRREGKLRPLDTWMSKVGFLPK